MKKIETTKEARADDKRSINQSEKVVQRNQIKAILLFREKKNPIHPMERQ